MPSPLRPAIDDLMPLMRQGDLPGFQRVFERLHRDGQRLSPDQLTEAAGELGELLARGRMGCSRGWRWSRARSSSGARPPGR